MKHITILYLAIFFSLFASFTNAQDALLPHELEWFDLLKTWSEDTQEKTIQPSENIKSSKIDTKITQTSHFKTPKKLPKTGSQ